MKSAQLIPEIFQPGASSCLRTSFVPEYSAMISGRFCRFPFPSGYQRFPRRMLRKGAAHFDFVNVKACSRKNQHPIRLTQGINWLFSFSFAFSFSDEQSQIGNFL
jgi:hypothetical protein